jgi:hypothetical protein
MITARYTGTALCGHLVARGERVLYSRASKKVLECAQCAEQAQRDRAAHEFDEAVHESTMPVGMRDRW